MLFAFRTECCSESQRNGVRLQNGIAFAFDRIPHLAKNFHRLARSGRAENDITGPCEHGFAQAQLRLVVLYTENRCGEGLERALGKRLGFPEGCRHGYAVNVGRARRTSMHFHRLAMRNHVEVRAT